MYITKLWGLNEIDKDLIRFECQMVSNKVAFFLQYFH